MVGYVEVIKAVTNVCLRSGGAVPSAPLLATLLSHTFHQTTTVWDTEREKGASCRRYPNHESLLTRLIDQTRHRAPDTSASVCGDVPLPSAYVPSISL